MTKQETAAEIAETIRAFLDGAGGHWDWDDFTACPLGDPELESIRLEAGAVVLPLDEEGRVALVRLASEADRLAQP